MKTDEKTKTPQEKNENRENPPKLISIVGLTASGKSAIGIKLAQLFNGEVISADSRQIYRGLDIGSAKVTPEECQGIPHHMLDIVEPGTRFDVFDFQQRAFACINDIIARGKTPILVGGTGLYTRAVVENYDFVNKRSGDRIYNVLQIALLPPREWLEPRVALRNDLRLQQGNLDETRNLLANGVSPDWLKSLGLDYYWNTLAVTGEIDMPTYLHWLAIKTMQYAKRQRTWFKRERDTHFLTDPTTFESESIRLVRDFLL